MGNCFSSDELTFLEKNQIRRELDAQKTNIYEDQKRKTTDHYINLRGRYGSMESPYIQIIVEYECLGSVLQFLRGMTRTLSPDNEESKYRLEITTKDLMICARDLLGYEPIYVAYTALLKKKMLKLDLSEEGLTIDEKHTLSKLNKKRYEEMRKQVYDFHGFYKT